MAFFTSMESEVLGLYDNELMITYFPPGNLDGVLGRDSLENVHHSQGSPESHPTLSHVMKNTSGHVYLKGSFEFEWSWPDNDVTEEELDSYIALVGLSPVTITKGVDKITMALDAADVEITGWTGQLLSWHPKAPVAKVTMTSEESEFICVSRLNGSYHSYTFEQRTVEPGQTIELDRPDCDTCYFMFSDHVLKGSQVLLGKKMYKVTSQSLEITNNQSTRIRILRYYK